MLYDCFYYSFHFLSKYHLFLQCKIRFFYKYFDYVLVVFFSQLLFIEDNFLFFLFINLQVEHILEKFCNEP